MQVKVKSERTKRTEYKTVKLEVGKFIVTDSHTDGKLTDQAWSIKGGFKETHPTAYEPKNLHFSYYQDISFLNSENNSSFMSFYDEISEPTFVENWDEFKGFDHVLCIYLGMDGNIYKINDPKPVSLWRYQDYIGGFCNDKYDLNKVESLLKRKKWIRNVKQIEIPYYNQHDGITRAVEFEYKLPSKKDLGKKLKANKMFADHYFGCLQQSHVWIL